MSLTAAMLERNANFLIAVGGIAALALAIGAFIDPPTMARAVLFAWLYWLGIAVGAMILLATHRLTGGRWGEAAGPVLRPAARAIFIAALPFAIVVLSSRLIYPWPSGAAQTYLNPLSFTVRGLAVLAIWSWFGYAAARHERLGTITASIALALYFPTITIAAIDWSASLLPRWSSSAYGVLIGAAQVTAALAFGALLISGESEGTASPDTGGLLIAGILGTTYLGFMQFLVIWSSGMPDKAAWYELRLSPHTVILIIIAFVFGVLIPFLLLIRSNVRSDPTRTGTAGLAVLIGLAFFWAWQIPPTNSAHAVLFYPLAYLAAGALWLGMAFGPLAKAQLQWSGLSHDV